MYYGMSRMGYGFGIDPMYILTIIMAIVCMIASARVSSVYKKYNKIRSMSGMTVKLENDETLKAKHFVKKKTK